MTGTSPRWKGPGSAGTTEKDLRVIGDLKLGTRKQQRAQANRLGLKLQKQGLFR